jgi:hypothetical protein
MIVTIRNNGTNFEKRPARGHFRYSLISLVNTQEIQSFNAPAPFSLMLSLRSEQALQISGSGLEEFASGYA